MILANTGAWLGFVGVVMSATIGGPIMFFLHRFDRRNTEQHAVNKEIQESILTEVGEVKGIASSAKEAAEAANQNIIDHLEWHLTPGASSVPLALPIRRPAHRAGADTGDPAEEQKDAGELQQLRER